MIRSFYESASAMMAQMTRQYMVNQNLSNVGTPGFKEQVGAINGFRDMLLNRYAGQNVNEIGTLSTAVRMDQPAVNFAQGALAETGNPLDLAITGDGFFAIETPDGVQYTRDGTFHLDADRRIVTNDGMAVLGENGPIIAPAGQVWVEADGTVRVDDLLIDQLQLIAIDQDAEIERVGQNRFAVAGDVALSETAGVSQGFLEQSNVDLNQSMVEMLAAGRSYGLAQRMLQMSDDSLRLAVNEVGRVN